MRLRVVFLEILVRNFLLFGAALSFSCSVELVGNLTSTDDEGDVVTAAPSDLIYEISDEVAILNKTTLNISPNVTGTVTEYEIDVALPAGLTLNSSTGAITGSPTASAPSTRYTITARNAAGDVSYAFNLRTAEGFIVNSNGTGSDAVINGICETAPGNGICTLPAAIAEANVAASTQVIKILKNQTITLAGSQLDLLSHMEIIGEERDSVIISANNNSRIFRHANNSLTVTYEKMTLRDGSVADDGGAIWAVGGEMTIREVTFLSNDATGGSGRGGAIYINNSFGFLDTHLLIYKSHFEGNTANHNALDGGGAIFAIAENLLADETTFSGNSQLNANGTGGAIVTYSNNNTFTRSLFVSNVSAYGAGGIVIWDGHTIVTNTTFSENLAQNDFGGAVTFVNNSTARFTNNTFFGNRLNAGAGSGAIYLNGTGPIELANNLFERNMDGASSEDCQGHGIFTSLGGNMSDHGSGDCDIGSGPGDQNNADADIQALADNGGSVLTHLFLAGAVSHDTGLDLECPATDARGISRPQGNGCDVGAVEIED